MGRSVNAAKLSTWRERLARFETSNLSVTEFCRQHGVTAARFYYWSQRLREADSQSQKQVRVQTADLQQGESRTDSGESVVELLIGDQLRVRIPAHNTSLVTTILAQLHAGSSARSSFHKFELTDASTVRR